MYVLCSRNVSKSLDNSRRDCKVHMLLSVCKAQKCQILVRGGVFEKSS